jgi:hypothetical protein
MARDDSAPGSRKPAADRLFVTEIPKKAAEMASRIVAAMIRRGAAIARRAMRRRRALLSIASGLERQLQIYCA